MADAWQSIVDWVQGHLTDFALVKIYIACAVAGGAVLVGQTGLNLLGLGDGGDIDADMDVDDMDVGGDGLSFLSVRTLASFLTFFGLVGWGGTASDWPGWVTILAAFAAGSSVMVFVAWVMRFFHRMASSGNLDPSLAIGKTARVYLRIPAQRSGKGKVTLELQGRSLEYEAVTAGDELPTGSSCRIVALRDAGTFDVAALED